MSQEDEDYRRHFYRKLDNRTDYQRYVLDSTWREFEHGPGRFDRDGYEKFRAERKAYFAAGRHKTEAPNILRSWAHEIRLIFSQFAKVRNRR